jgi:hypothetical protein
MGEVTSFGAGRGGPRDPPHERWLRRQAAFLVTQLPEDPADAMKIIEQMAILMRVFIDPAPPN